MVGETVKMSGTIPYEDADATLGLDAGNRIALKFNDADVTAKTDLLDGELVVVKGETVTNRYTKDAFEDDGSLILVTNVKKGPVKVSIKWTATKTVNYVIDITGAALEQA